jgi:putative protease
MELFVYAVSADCAEAAIQNGAGGILLPPSIPPESMGSLFSYARTRGAKTVLDLTRACGDADLYRCAGILSKAYDLGLDAVMSGEPGILRMALSAAPGCKHIWGAPCNTADDIDCAAANGCSMAVLSPFLHEDAMLSLAGSSGLPLLFWALTPLCPAGGGDCCLLDKSRSPYRCEQICRTALYAYPGDAVAPILKTRDLSLLKYMRNLSGLTAMVMPPDPSPEAAGLFTRFARSAAVENYVNQHELNEAFEALGRSRPTDAPYIGTGEVYTHEEPEKNERLWDAICKKMADRPAQAGVPVRFFALITAGEPSRLAVDDYQGHTLYAEGAVPLTVDNGQSDNHNYCGEGQLNEVWRGLSGGYFCKDARTKIDPGLFLTAPQAVALREEALRKLEGARLALPERVKGGFDPGISLLPRADAPKLTIRVTKMSQVTDELLSLPPERLYIPLDEASGDPAKAEWLVKSDTVPVAMLPRVFAEEDRTEINARLRRLHEIGFRESLAWTPGQALLSLRQGFTPRCDWGVSSSVTLKAAKAMGAASCTLAPWLSLQEIGKMSHFCDTELIVYGRLPILLARKCLTRAQGNICICDNKCELSDGKGGILPLMRGGAHSTLVYHPQKLWMLPCRPQWRHIGLWAARLDFTTENARECVQIALAYAGRGEYEPHSCTTGFYIDGESRKKWGKKLQ